MAKPDGKVIPFGETILPGTPNPEIVERLEELLDMAKSGELRGIAYCTVRAGNIVSTGWAGSDGSRFPLGSGILILQQRYAEALMRPEGDNA